MNDMTKPVKDRLGFDPASVKKLSFGELVKKIGPGIILTGIVIGPGNITTSAMMGANYGYKMLWLLIPIILMGITFTLSSYRISIMTGLPILHAIRHYYGGIASGFCGVALFLSCFFFTLGNITGTGAGMNLIFGFDWRIGSLIMLAILAFCYLTKGVYSKVEKGIMICICGMIIAFFATSIATPVAGLFMVLMLWKKELFMGTKAPRVLQVSMTICYIFALYMTLTALKTQIPNLIHSFMG